MAFDAYEIDYHDAGLGIFVIQELIAGVIVCVVGIQVVFHPETRNTKAARHVIDDPMGFAGLDGLIGYLQAL